MEMTWSMIFTAGGPRMVGWFVSLSWETFYRTQCMKRRCFTLNVVFTDVAHKLLVQYTLNNFLSCLLVTPAPPVDR